MTLDEAQAKVEDWLIKMPLYKALTDDNDDSRANAIKALCIRSRPFDMYCVHCKNVATFTPVVVGDIPTPGTVVTELRIGFQNLYLNVGQFQVNAVCARDTEHIARFVFLHLDGQMLQKIGQHPSLADLSIPETSQFVKVLGRGRVHELNTAIGLAAHGVGAGSFVYLRRIFESLLEEAHKAVLEDTKWDETDEGWDEGAYQRSRVGERVAMVKDYLPAFLVENSLLYGILSKHLHELSEDDCLDNFDAVKEAILIIARDKLKAQEEKEQRERTTKLLQRIVQP